MRHTEEDSTNSAIQKSASDLFEVRATDILEVSELQILALPDEKITFYSPNMLSTFHRVRSIASNILGLPSLILNPSINEAQFIHGALTHCATASGIGRERLAKDYNCTHQEVEAEIDIAEMIEVGIVELRQKEQEKYSDINIAYLFSIYALSCLVDVKNKFIESGRTTQERTTQQEAASSHESIVNANGHLFDAILGLEKSTRYLIKVIGEEKVKKVEADALSKTRTRAIDKRHERDSIPRRAYIIKLLKSGNWSNPSDFVNNNLDIYLKECTDQTEWKQAPSNAPKFMKEVINQHIKDHPSDCTYLENNK
jgi:cell division protein ZapA (FtsZ GTPase activity inhibitor)